MESEFDYLFLASFATPIITELIKSFLDKKEIEYNSRYIVGGVIACFSFVYAIFMSFASDELISSVSTFAGVLWVTATGIYKLQK